MKNTIVLSLIILVTSFLASLSYGQQTSPKVEQNLHHSYQDLGSHFSSQNYMTPSHGAQLSLIDMELAKELGFSTEDLGQLEREMVKRYALETTKEKTNTQRMSTSYAHYQHHTGDGRAVWHEEIKITLKSGKIVYLDVSTKGIGKTNSAGQVWTTRQHGYQTLREAVHSFLQSKKNVLEGLDSTRDLAVIKLPVEAVFGESTHPVAITVRVGRQIRPAHYGSAAQKSDGIAKLLKYEMIRNLGYPLNHKLTPQDAKLYLDSFVDNFAQETARMKDLFFFHGMLHASNASSTGGSIDFGTSRQLDGYYSQILNSEGQATGKFENIFFVSLYYMGLIPQKNMSNIFGNFQQGAMPESVYNAIRATKSGSFIHGNLHYELKEDRIIGPALEEYSLAQFEQRFNQTMKKSFTELALARIGLSAKQVEAVSRHPEVVASFYNSIEKIYFSSNGELPKYDTHRILSKAVEIVTTMDYQKDGFGRLAKGDRSWEQPLQNNDENLMEFLTAVKKIVAQVPASAAAEITNRAQHMMPKERVDYNLVTTEDAILSTDLERKLYDQVKEGRTTVAENNKIANEIIETHTHKNLPERKTEFTHSFANKEFRSKVESEIHPRTFKLMEHSVEKKTRMMEPVTYKVTKPKARSCESYF